MGALSPETRNRQVALFQSGEVDYIVATDAIGMGLNLDVDPCRLRRAEQVRRRAPAAADPGRDGADRRARRAPPAGRHLRHARRDGQRDDALEFTADEVYAIEEHRFAPLTRLFWREAEPRFDSLGTLLADLEAPPEASQLAPRPRRSTSRCSSGWPRIRRSPAASRRRARCGGSGRPASCPTSASRGPTCTRASSRGCGRTCARPPRRRLRRRADRRARPHRGRHRHAAGAHRRDPLAGPISASGPTGCSRATRWPRAPAPPRRGCRDALHARLTERFVNRRTAVLMRTMGKDAGSAARWRSTRRGASRSRTSRSGISRASASWSTPTRAPRTAS